MSEKIDDKDDEIEDKKPALPEADDKKPAPEGEEITIEVSPEDAKLDTESREETPEDRHARRREEKKQRKERQRAARVAKDHEIEELRAGHQALGTRVQELTSYIAKQGVVDLDGRLAAAQSRAKEATEVFAAAMKAGDEKSAVEALEIRDNARDEARALAAYKARATAPQPRPQPQAPDPAVTRRIRDFAEEHPWFDTNARDEDSRVVVAIDAQVAADGFDPRTDEYWDELEDRLTRRLPDRMGATTRPQAARRGPQLGAGRTEGSQGGKRTVFVSRERKEAMVEAGLWDDVKKRNQMLRQYDEYDRAAKH